MQDATVIQSERADTPQVVAMLGELDGYLASLYEPEANHIMGVQAVLDPSVTFLTARRAGSLLGCGAVRRRPGDVATDGAAYGEIKRMFVRPQARGERIAARLLAQLEALLLADHITLALLETGSAQTDALRLYQRAGYTPRAAFGGYPHNGLSVYYAKALR